MCVCVYAYDLAYQYRIMRCLFTCIYSSGELVFNFVIHVYINACKFINTHTEKHVKRIYMREYICHEYLDPSAWTLSGTPRLVPCQLQHAATLLATLQEYVYRCMCVKVRICVYVITYTYSRD